MVFHNSKTPLLWLSKIPVGLQGTAALSPQGLSEGRALQCPQTGAVTVSPADGVRQDQMEKDFADLPLWDAHV